MATSSKPILVVDDERDNRALLRRLLEISGFQVVEARDGVEALEIAETTPPALVLLDLFMPRLDGWQTANRLRAIPALAQVPIMVLSASGLRDGAARALAAGCNDYVSKPIEINDFMRRVRSYL